MQTLRLLKALIVAILFCCASSAALAQVNDSRKFELIVVTNAQNTEADAKLLSDLQSHPGLGAIAARCKVHKFTPASQLYQQRYAQVMPITELPMIALARWDGGVVYKAIGSRIPATDELVSQLKHFAGLARDVEQPAMQNSFGPTHEWNATNINGDCPPCQVPFAPNQSGIRPFPNIIGPDVIPETINVQPQFNVPSSVWLGVAIVIGLFALIGFLMVAFLVLVIFRR